MRWNLPVMPTRSIALTAAIMSLVAVGCGASAGAPAAPLPHSAAPAAIAETGTVAAPAPSTDPADATAAILAGLSQRGTHCIECYLLWNTNSGEFSTTGQESKPAVTGAAWLGIDLSTADGKTIRLSDLAGRPVLIELMATWCASCAAQQDILREVRPTLPADTVIVSLDVDPSSAASTLAPYAAAHGYDWIFAPSPLELSRALQAQFGDLVLNPAASPIVVIDRAGTASLAPLGHKDAAAIVALLPEG